MLNQNAVDFPQCTAPAREIWDQNALWWDNKIGDGNDFQNYLIEPQTEKLLGLMPAEGVLDIACGAGRFARRMAAVGARVTAIDHSVEFIKRAQARSQGLAVKIDYQVVDASDPAALLALGESRFDAAVCTMALMDMACITPLISTLPRLLKPGARLVFSVTHPVFNSGAARLFAEQIDIQGRLAAQYGVKTTEYITPFVLKGEGIAGQPAPQYYFHRPISVLFNTFFQYGWVLDGMEESTFPDNVPLKPGAALSFYNARSLPPIMVARMRLKV